MKLMEEWRPTFPGKRDLAGGPCELPTGYSRAQFHAEELNIQKEMKNLVGKGFSSYFGNSEKNSQITVEICKLQRDIKMGS